MSVAHERPIETERDPLFVARAAASFLESVGGMLRVIEPEDLRERLAADTYLREALLDQIAGVGTVLARLSVLIEAYGSADPGLFLDLADRAEELWRLREDIAARRVPA